ncbi:MAG TPA: recombinase family protein [Rhizomicrobium sp.]
MSKRVAVYARVSTTRQAENDISIPDQLVHARRYCAERGWHVVREFVDPGASARDDKRPEFQQMMDSACIDPSPFDVVLVHSQSRFFRDTAGYVLSKRRLQKHAVSLVSMTQDFGEGAAADFAETVIAASDALNSAETAKHVTRTMLENARQGFWNGALPPFGYRTVEAERRGQRIKKHLQIEPREAELVRQIFRLFLEGDGMRGPMGVKDIVSWLNARGFRNSRSNPFYTGTVHLILTRESYTGTHHYNCTDSRTRRARPKEEWVAISIPQIIPVEQFQLVQQRLHSRRPRVTPPRITNSPVLLTGIARCQSCGGALMLRTGKNPKYRYYTCANRRLKGRTACADPITVAMAEFDRLVIGALTDQLLNPERLPVLLREAHKHRRALTSGNLHRRSALRRQLKETDAQIRRLYTALAEGIAGDTALFREALHGLEAKRDESIRLLSLLDVETPPVRHALSKAQAQAVAATLKRRLIEAPPPMQRRYIHGLVSEIVVDREKAVISGPRAAIAAAITAGTHNSEVRSFVREWRTRQDSNL